MVDACLKFRFETFEPRSSATNTWHNATLQKGSAQKTALLIVCVTIPKLPPPFIHTVRYNAQGLIADITIRHGHRVVLAGLGVDHPRCIAVRALQVHFNRRFNRWPFCLATKRTRG